MKIDCKYNDFPNTLFNSYFRYNLYSKIINVFSNELNKLNKLIKFNYKLNYKLNDIRYNNNLMFESCYIEIKYLINYSKYNNMFLYLNGIIMHNNIWNDSMWIMNIPIALIDNIDDKDYNKLQNEITNIILPLFKQKYLSKILYLFSIDISNYNKYILNHFCI